jgi:hypothetical protein
MILTKKESSFLHKVVEGTWSINSNTGLVDVDGSVDMSYMSLTEMPVKFGNVSGYFYCTRNQLTNLHGAPKSVGYDFCCSYNKLTNLVGAPEIIGGCFIVYLGNIDKKYYHVIPEIEEMIKGYCII